MASITTCDKASWCRGAGKKVGLIIAAKRAWLSAAAELRRAKLIMMGAAVNKKYCGDLRVTLRQAVLPFLILSEWSPLPLLAD